MNIRVTEVNELKSYVKFVLWGHDYCGPLVYRAITFLFHPLRPCLHSATDLYYTIHATFVCFGDPLPFPVETSYVHAPLYIMHAEGSFTPLLWIPHPRTNVASQLKCFRTIILINFICRICVCRFDGDDSETSRQAHKFIEVFKLVVNFHLLKRNTFCLLSWQNWYEHCFSDPWHFSGEEGDIPGTGVSPASVRPSIQEQDGNFWLP